MNIQELFSLATTLFTPQTNISSFVSDVFWVSVYTHMCTLELVGRGEISQWKQTIPCSPFYKIFFSSIFLFLFLFRLNMGLEGRVEHNWYAGELLHEDEHHGSCSCSRSSKYYHQPCLVYDIYIYQDTTSHLGLLI